MGKPTGFMEWSRDPAQKTDRASRIDNFNEFTLPMSEEQKTHQAGRCMDCGVATCHQGCPLGNVIPDFNDHVFKGRWREAFAVLQSTNVFPEFTGRLCPAPCESACVLAINQAPVTIEYIEKEIAERAFAEGWIIPRPPAFRSGKRVAIVGSGPAGLAAASYLNSAGHSVTVFERDESPGGLLRFGIPEFKIEKRIVDRRLRILEAEGIEFRCGVEVGGTLSWPELKATHDAVVIAIGAGQARALSIPGSELTGVVQAMDFLAAQNRGTPISVKDQRVIILGGGDTGSDCLGTALRQGAKDVKQVELLPMPPAIRSLRNPWPDWPLVFRTSSSQEEGGERQFALKTTHLEGVNGKVTALNAVDVETGKQLRYEIETLILALGFVGPVAKSLHEQLQVNLDARGNVKVGTDWQTNIPGVFSAGDAMRGASLIVWAIADGRETARSVDAFLQF